MIILNCILNRGLGPNELSYHLQHQLGVYLTPLAISLCKVLVNFLGDLFTPFPSIAQICQIFLLRKKSQEKKSPKPSPVEIP